jgi:hypothetical protein
MLRYIAIHPRSILSAIPLKTVSCTSPRHTEAHSFVLLSFLHVQPRMSETTNASKSDSKTQTYSWISHLLICVVLTVVAIVVSFGITKHLVLGDVNDNVPYTGSAEQQVSALTSFSPRNFIAVFPFRSDSERTTLRSTRPSEQ